MDRIETAEIRTQQLRQNPAPTVPQYDLSSSAVATSPTVFAGAELFVSSFSSATLWSMFLCDGIANPNNQIFVPADPFGYDTISYTEGPAFNTLITDNTWHSITLEFTFTGSAGGPDNFGGTTTWYYWTGELTVDGITAHSMNAAFDGVNGGGPISTLNSVALWPAALNFYVDNLSIVTSSNSYFSDFESGFDDYAANTGDWELTTFGGHNCITPATGFGSALGVTPTPYAHITISMDVRGVS